MIDTKCVPRTTTDCAQKTRSRSIQGTKILLKLPTSLRQHTHLSKLFIANVTLQSSHKLRHLHGHTIILRGALWQTTHCGPPDSMPVACSAQEPVLPGALGLSASLGDLAPELGNCRRWSMRYCNNSASSCGVSFSDLRRC